MAKIKKKLISAQKRAKKEEKDERQKKYMWVFMNGKQDGIKHPETIDGVDLDIRADKLRDGLWYLKIGPTHHQLLGTCAIAGRT